MAKLTKQDIAEIRESIAHSGEFRVHITYARSGLGVKARMWHPDGTIVGSCTGGGYDKRGTVLGQAIELLFTQEQLRAVPRVPRPVKYGEPAQLMPMPGMHEIRDSGKYIIDGSCGIESMLELLRALGYDVAMYSTGKLSDLVVARRMEPAQHNSEEINQ